MNGRLMCTTQPHNLYHAIQFKSDKPLKKCAHKNVLSIYSNVRLCALFSLLQLLMLDETIVDWQHRIAYYHCHLQLLP